MDPFNAILYGAAVRIIRFLCLFAIGLFHREPKCDYPHKGVLWCFACNRRGD